MYQINLLSLRNLVEAFSTALIKLALAIVIFLLGFIIGKLVGRIAFKMLKEIEINTFIKNSTGLRINADHLISSILSYSIYFLATVAALEQIGVANVILYFLAAAVIIVILISFFLAVRDFLPNLISGIYLYRKEALKEGKKIEINGIKGELIHMDLFQIKIKTKKGDVLYMPNSVVAKSEIKILR